MNYKRIILLALVGVLLLVALAPYARANDTPSDVKIEEGLRAETTGLKTDDTLTPNLADQELAKAKAGSEKFQFQAEVNKLLGIIINSLYTNKEIFLREVISNASDALDKIRFISLTNPDALGKTPELEIRIKADKERNTLTIRDTGIGMTKEDLINNLGTIAKSGTKSFVEKLTDSNADMNLIGQFGVGFYSVFLVADTVQVATKHNDDKQYIWESTADNTFSIFEDTRPDHNLGRGTEITLFLKDDAFEYLEEETLKKLINKYSEFIHFPIYLYTTKTVEKEVPIHDDIADIEVKPASPDDLSEEAKAALEKAAEATKKTEEEAKVEEADDEEEDEDEKEPTTKTITEEVNEWELINQNKPIWTRDPKTVNEEEYHNFYKSITREFDDPITYTHFSTEGDVAFKSVLFVPGHAPSNIFEGGSGNSNIKLYVRRVFITDNFNDLMPRYLHFIRGVVDSDDLPLNVSREILQQSSLLQKIKKKLVKKVLEMFKKLADDAIEEDSKKEEEGAEGDNNKAATAEKKKESKFDKFWNEYGKHIRLGLIEDRANRERLASLLRYKSTKSGNGYTSLPDYVSRMKEGQKNIYIITGESYEAVEKSPFLEKFKELDIEVLYMVDAIDEYVVQHMTDYDGKKFTSITREGVKLTGDENADKEAEKALKEEFDPLTKWLKKTLEGKIEKAKVSKLLSTSPCVLASPEYGISANMERIIKAQALGNDNAQLKAMRARKVMEINPNHPIIKDLKKRIAQYGEADQVAKDTAELLYDTALLQSGFSLDHTDHADFATRIHRMLETMAANANASSASSKDKPEQPPIETTTTTTSATTVDHDEL